MATVSSRLSLTQPTRDRSDRFDTPARRRKPEARREIWTTLLRQTQEVQARSRANQTQQRELIVLGGTPEDQRHFLTSLSRPPPLNAGQRRDAPRRAKGELRLSNKFAYGYGWMSVFGPPSGLGGLYEGGEELVRLGVHTIPSADAAFASVLARLLAAGQKEGGEEEQVEEAGRPALVILLNWAEPWTFLAGLKAWLQLLIHALHEQADDPWQALKELKLTVVVQGTETQETLERDGWSEERFDYVCQTLRTILLPLSAGLVYQSTAPSATQQSSSNALTPVQAVCFTALDLALDTLQPAAAKGAAPAKKEDPLKHNVVDRERICVPRGWDSAGKIRVLRENFDVEAVLQSWQAELARTPETPRQQNSNNSNTKSGSDTSSSLESVPGAERSNEPASAQAAYESQIPDPAAHNPRPHASPPHIEVTTQPPQHFLAGLKAELDALAAAEKPSPRAPAPDPGAAVAFNLGGITYDAEQAIHALHQRRAEAQPQPPSSPAAPRNATPRPPRREDRDGSATPTGARKGSDVPTEDLQRFFTSLMKKGGGSGAGTPQR